MANHQNLATWSLGDEIRRPGPRARAADAHSLNEKIKLAVSVVTVLPVVSVAPVVPVVPCGALWCPVMPVE